MPHLRALPRPAPLTQGEACALTQGEACAASSVTDLNDLLCRVGVALGEEDGGSLRCCGELETLLACSILELTGRIVQKVLVSVERARADVHPELRLLVHGDTLALAADEDE